MNATAASAFSTSSLRGELKGSNVFEKFSSAWARERRVSMTLLEYLEGCKNDPTFYSSAAERMIAAIGEPTVVDTSKDSRLGRVFLNRTIKIYPTMTGFYGMEDTSTPRRGSKSASRCSICWGRWAAANLLSPNGSRR